MKRKGVTWNLRRLLQTLVAAGAVVGLCPSPAQAKIACGNYTTRTCGAYTCCIQFCAYCYDTDTGDIYSFVCGEPDCWTMFD